MSSVAVSKPTPYDAAVVEVQGKLEELKTTLSILLRFQAEFSGSGSTATLARNEADISHDTFFSMTIGDAAKKYLSMAKVTKATAEIAAALERGGLKHSSKDFATTVRSILGPREDFTRVPNGDWGLAEWYPAQGRAKKPKTKGRKPRKAPKPSNARKAASKPTVPSPEKEPPATPQGGPQARVEVYQAGHPGATSREISDALGIRIQTVGLILGKQKRVAA